MRHAVGGFPLQIFIAFVVQSRASPVPAGASPREDNPRESIPSVVGPQPRESRINPRVFWLPPLPRCHPGAAKSSSGSEGRRHAESSFVIAKPRSGCGNLVPQVVILEPHLVLVRFPGETRDPEPFPLMSGLSGQARQ